MELGKNTVARPLFPLPENLAEWEAYGVLSQQEHLRDRQCQLECTCTAPVYAPYSKATQSLPFPEDSTWFASPQARTLADNVLSFQTPAGGWSKNLDFSDHARRPGECYFPDNRSKFLQARDNDACSAGHYMGTFDDGATTTQLRFLQRVWESQGHPQIPAALLRGLRYVLHAQYPHGGWPQVWPLEGGYHDGVTYNDDAMISVLEWLEEIESASWHTQSVPVHAAWVRGVECILRTQCSWQGQPAIWAQQYDPWYLTPAPARNFEMPAFCTTESVRVVQLLMRIPQPTEAVRIGIHGALRYFSTTALYDFAFLPTPQGRQWVPTPKKGPSWARFYDFAENLPVFADRNAQLTRDVNTLSQERRDGYAWFTQRPKSLYRDYAAWCQQK